MAPALARPIGQHGPAGGPSAWPNGHRDGLLASAMLAQADRLGASLASELSERSDWNGPPGLGFLLSRWTETSPRPEGVVSISGSGGTKPGRPIPILGGRGWSLPGAEAQPLWSPMAAFAAVGSPWSRLRSKIIDRAGARYVCVRTRREARPGYDPI